MRATRFTHVSIHAYDLEESMRFYVDVFGMRRVPAPGLRSTRSIWLEVGDQQLHLFLRDTPAPEFHHIGLDVDDFEAAYRVACERGLFDRERARPTCASSTTAPRRCTCATRPAISSRSTGPTPARSTTRRHGHPPASSKSARRATEAHRAPSLSATATRAAERRRPTPSTQYR